MVSLSVRLSLLNQGLQRPQAGSKARKRFLLIRSLRFGLPEGEKSPDVTLTVVRILFFSSFNTSLRLGVVGARVEGAQE